MAKQTRVVGEFHAHTIVVSVPVRQSGVRHVCVQVEVSIQRKAECISSGVTVNVERWEGGGIEERGETATAVKFTHELFGRDVG